MLPNGITGFRNLKDPYIPEQEKRIFQRFCYSIATRYHCEVLSFDLDLASKNFYSAEIKTEQVLSFGKCLLSMDCICKKLGLYKD